MGAAEHGPGVARRRRSISLGIFEACRVILTLVPPSSNEITGCCTPASHSSTTYTPDTSAMLRRPSANVKSDFGCCSSPASASHTPETGGGFSPTTTRSTTKDSPVTPLKVRLHSPVYGLTTVL